MGLLPIKSPMLAYLDKNIFGTFVRQSEEGAENGYVYIYFIPLNKMSVHKLPMPIKKTYIHHTSATDTDTTGVVDNVYYIHTDEDGSLMSNIIDAKWKKRYEDAMIQNKQLHTQLSTTKMYSEELSAGAESSVAKAKAIADGGGRQRRGLHGFGDIERDFNDEYDF